MHYLIFTKLHEDATSPSYSHEGDAGLDLSCVERFTLAPGQRRLVGTGVAVVVPDGMCGLVVPRSGLAHNYGVTVCNSPGLIDSGYRGELKVNLINLGDEAVTFQPGDRIAQLLIQSFEECKPFEMDAQGWKGLLSLPTQSNSRGTNGIGSTGR